MAAVPKIDFLISSSSSVAANFGKIGISAIVVYKTFAFTNWTNDPTVDCNGAVAVVGDGLGTVVNELIQLGIIQGSVAA